MRKKSAVKLRPVRLECEKKRQTLIKIMFSLR